MLENLFIASFIVAVGVVAYVLGRTDGRRSASSEIMREWYLEGRRRDREEYKGWVPRASGKDPGTPPNQGSGGRAPHR